MCGSSILTHRQLGVRRLRLQNTQDARRVIDPLLSMAEHHIALGTRGRTSEQRAKVIDAPESDSQQC